MSQQEERIKKIKTAGAQFKFWNNLGVYAVAIRSPRKQRWFQILFLPQGKTEWITIFSGTVLGFTVISLGPILGPIVGYASGKIVGGILRVVWWANDKPGGTQTERTTETKKDLYIP